MNTSEPIICGVDGSAGSGRAVVTARTLSEGLRCPLVLVHVVPPRPPMPLASVHVGGLPWALLEMAELNRLESEEAFASVAGELADTDAEQTTEQGFAPERLSAIAEKRNARLIVVGARGIGQCARRYSGLSHKSLAACASRPVLVVPRARANARLPGPWARVRSFAVSTDRTGRRLQRGSQRDWPTIWILRSHSFP